MTAHPITPDALEAAHWLLAGTTGSGKTYLERGLLEQLRRAGRRVGAIDPRSKLWGLTVSADGASAGLEFVIFGGKRPGAVPMRPHDGDRIGRLFVERNIPAIFDLYGWDEDEQDLWVDAFARAVFAANTTALHLAIDEVQTFVPSRGAQGLAYKAIKLLATQGRGDGINLLMTAPRLDGVDVDVRQALGGMVAMRQTAVVDRKAVAELIGGHLAIDERHVRDDLASLPDGTGLVWSPGATALARIAFPANTTFDSSRTPRHGDAPPPPIAVSSALVEELRAALAPPKAAEPEEAATIEEAGKAYRAAAAAAEAIAARDRRIAELEGELQGWRDLHDRRLAELKAAQGQIAAARKTLSAVAATLETPAVSADVAGGMLSEAPPAQDLAAPVNSPRVSKCAAGEGKPPVPAARSGLSAKDQQLLDAVAWIRATLHVDPADRTVLAIVIGTHVRTKGFLNRLGELRSAGLIDYRAGGVVLTDAGEALAARPSAMGSDPQALRAIIREWLPPAQERLLAEVIKRYPGDIDRDVLAAELDVHPRTKGFLNNIGRLRTLGLLADRGGNTHIAADFLFGRRR